MVIKDVGAELVSASVTKEIMANRNYVKGRNFEYAVMRYLRKRGYYCIRAYGSKGLYDVIAIPTKEEKSQQTLDESLTCLNCFNQKPLLVQAKYNGYVPKQEREKLAKHDKWAGTTLIAFSKRKKGAKVGFTTFKTLDGKEVFIK